MRCHSMLFTLMLLVLCNELSAAPPSPKPTFKFGDIKTSDFIPKYYSIDSNASAIVLADVGSSKFEGNNNGFFSIVYQRFQRIRIMKRNGFDYAKFEISLHNIGDKQEKMTDIQAVTYNVENDKVITTKVEKSSYFNSNIIKGLREVTFSMPNVKEGSIIECTYTIVTPFFEFLRSWNFQRSIPILWSQYQVHIPDLFNYVIAQQGPKDFDFHEKSSYNYNYNISEPSGNAFESSQTYHINTEVHDNLWAIKDMPAFVQQPFMSSINNYIQLLRFQLKEIRWSESNIEDRMGSWMSFSKALLKSEYFGQDLNNSNSFATEINEQLKNVVSDKQRAEIIFNYIRDNFTCTDDETYEADNSLKKVYQVKKGNVAEINLLLTSLLRSHGLKADPVLISTREHGYANVSYPLKDGFNYVIVQLNIDDHYYLLDAADKSLGFNILRDNEYNGGGRIVAEIPLIVPMMPDSLIENKKTAVFIYNDDDAKGMNGTVKIDEGIFESVNLRKDINKKGEQYILSNIKKSYPPEMIMKNEKIDSLKDLDNPISISYDLDIKKDADLIYFNPVLTDIIKKNPFLEEERLYPVEMPYRSQYTYVLTMEIPKGYKVDEIPKSMITKLNENEGLFEYRIVNTEDMIQFRLRLNIMKAKFEKEDYKTLREFYGMIVKKESEVVVFKKIK